MTIGGPIYDPTRQLRDGQPKLTIRRQDRARDPVAASLRHGVRVPDRPGPRGKRQLRQPHCELEVMGGPGQRPAIHPETWAQRWRQVPPAQVRPGGASGAAHVSHLPASRRRLRHL